MTLPDGRVQSLSTRHIVIAAGASPLVPPLPGLQEVGCLTSDTIWGLTECPKRLLVLGGGPIGCELARALPPGRAGDPGGNGSRVMMKEDPEVSALVAASLQADGIQLLTRHQALRCERVDGTKRLIVRQVDAPAGEEISLEFDQLLCAVGRRPRVSGYGLEELGLPLTPQKTIQTNAWLQTLYPNIYAVGDVPARSSSPTPPRTRPGMPR